MAALHPLLVFLDRTEDALAFYASVFGGEVELLRFRDVGLADTADADLVMRGCLETPHGFRILAGDVPAGVDFEYGRNVSVCLDGPESQVRGWFARLADGGVVTVPLTEVAWGRLFGQILDRFGVAWVVDLDLGRREAEGRGQAGLAVEPGSPPDGQGCSSAAVRIHPAKTGVRTADRAAAATADLPACR